MEEDVRVLEVADPGKQVSPPLLCSAQVPDSTVHDDTLETCNRIISLVLVSLQESLASEVVPDPMEGEQTWPSEEELREAEGEKVVAVRVSVCEAVILQQCRSSMWQGGCIKEHLSIRRPGL